MGYTPAIYEGEIVAFSPSALRSLETSNGANDYSVDLGEDSSYDFEGVSKPLTFEDIGSLEDIANDNFEEEMRGHNRMGLTDADYDLEMDADDDIGYDEMGWAA